MNIDFCNFSKKKNSTKIPAPTIYHTIGCTLKDASSISNPTITLLKNDYDLSWNYCHIGYFGRYYFVEDITVDGNIINISLSEDILASHRDDIINNNAFIEYAADSTENYLVDPRIQSNIESEYYSSDCTLTYLSSTYENFITVIGSTYESKFSKCYKISNANLSVLANLLFSNDIVTQLKTQFGDVMQGIVTLSKLPINTSSISGRLDQPLRIGKVEIQDGDDTADGTILSQYEIKESKQIEILWPTSDFRRASPYTQMYLYLPFIGTVELSTSDFVSSNYINIDVVYSIKTRQITYRIGASSALNSYIAMYTGQFGYTIPVSAVQSNASGAASAALSGAISSAAAIGVAAVTKTPGAIAGAVATTASTITNVGLAFAQKSVGMVGDFNGAGCELLGIKPTLMLVYHDTVVNPSSVADTIGRPYFKQDSISNHSGYIQCANASVNIDALNSDIDTINNYLNTGIYIE